MPLSQVLIEEVDRKSVRPYKICTVASINLTWLAFIEYSIQQQQYTHPSQMHTEHSPR